MRKGYEWFCVDFLYKCCGFFFRDNLDVGSFVYLKKCYSVIFNGVEEDLVIFYFERFMVCIFNGDLLGFCKFRSDRFVFILVRWCKFGGIVDSFGGDLRFGVVDFFMK